MPVIIKKVNKRSPANRVGIKDGDTLISINSNPINDVLDYQFYITEEKLEIEVLNSKSALKTFRVKKEEYEDLGLEFETYLMDKQHSCRNKCIFCFVDQMPKGMRETLYFKDDDSRMSFLFGNYITLTNLTEEDISRIIRMHISPINVSVHTTNPDLRVKMMKNKNAGKVLSYLNDLANHGIKLNTQLVLCPGINDGEELKRSLNDLSKLYPNINSIAAVPVGLTKYRDGLEQLNLYDKDSAQKVIDIIESFADDFYKQHGTRLCYASDEFYIKAGKPLPEYDYYEDFNQLDNGVGLVTMLSHEFYDALEFEEFSPNAFETTLATGELAYPFLKEFADSAMKKYPQVKINVKKIINNFFGESITVAGLVTGGDLISQLENEITTDTLLIPTVMLRHEQDKFLDDVTINEIETKLKTKVVVAQIDGYDLLCKMLGCE